MEREERFPQFVVGEQEEIEKNVVPQFVLVGELCVEQEEHLQVDFIITETPLTRFSSDLLVPLYNFVHSTTAPPSLVGTIVHRSHIRRQPPDPLSPRIWVYKKSVFDFKSRVVVSITDSQF
ncbi:uncharacterized protein LOC133291369 [Gastrolobium bilobum]|uniref:uncharacterized protein LOC133291369 n=1 Tax=Gastrolobium bilobum TaxID=150636 RepID=UPI002AB155C1|nr:uncharacterized protein LOC133291369 [Gastrolobium bilobum]